jgi:hypothetical protein
MPVVSLAVPTKRVAEKFNMDEFRRESVQILLSNTNGFGLGIPTGI